MLFYVLKSKRLSINDLLPVEEIPALWNKKMEEYLGIVPPNDKLGCLQDVHWSMGGIGYFPTYTLGNMYAAILFDSFAKDHPDWEKGSVQEIFPSSTTGKNGLSINMEENIEAKIFLKRSVTPLSRQNPISIT